MQNRVNPKNDDPLSILGFGCMRFPLKGGTIDEKRSIALLRNAVDNGINYFDTAYIYHTGRSESLLGKAFSDGYREKVFLATKLPCFMITSLKGAQKIFNVQLARLATDWIDYYLLHMLTDLAGFKRLQELGIIEWLEEIKKQGIIKNLGFSFHGGKTDFEEILNAYDWDFCQIQYNYLDENYQATKSGLQLASQKGIPVIVMEPLRGGKLVTDLPSEVLHAFHDQNPARTPAEWALRWIWNHKEVSVVLSGMSDEAQLAENIRVASDAFPDALSAPELAMFDEVKSILATKTKIPCTACGYCMPCPYGVDIPGCFSVYNAKYILNDKSAKQKYLQTTGALSASPSFASRCHDCGKCEHHCPQHIEIRKELKTIKNEMEGPIFRMMVGFTRRFLRIKR